MAKIGSYKSAQGAWKLSLILGRSQIAETYKVLIENIILQIFFLLNLPG